MTDILFDLLDLLADSPRTCCILLFAKPTCLQKSADDLFDRACDSLPLAEVMTDRSFCNPESTTYLIPGIVKPVSAIFVDTTILRTPFGAGSKTRFCCACDSTR